MPGGDDVRAPSPGTAEDIVEAALQAAMDGSLPAFFRFFTPEALAQDAAWSASTVRYRFGVPSGPSRRPTLAFDRDALSRATVRLALSRAASASFAAADVYLDVAAAARDAGTLDDIRAAVRANMLDFIPGGSDDRDAGGPERLYYIAAALSESDRDLAALLRESRHAVIANYEPMYAAFLEAFGRTMRPGFTLRDLANAVYSLLEGYLLRTRYEPTLDLEPMVEASLLLFAGFTVRRDERPWTVEDELLGGPRAG